MIPQWIRDYVASITFGEYVGYFVLGGVVRDNPEWAIFAAVVIAWVVGSLWAINRMDL